MPEHDAKEITLIVRKYFEDIKKSKFFFDVINVTFYRKKWTVECEITNAFADSTRQYTITVEDDSGEILDVSEIDEKK